MEQHGLLAAKLTRRRVAALGGAVMLAGMLGPRVGFAQGADDAAMGYPAMTVTIDEKQLTVRPQVPAGLTFVTVKNTMAKDGEHMIWGRLPDGVTREAVFAAATAAATPTNATPSGLDPITELFSRMTIVGGPDWAPPGGGQAQGIVKFTEGTYLLANVFGEQVAFFDVVAPGPDAKTEEPKADFTVKLRNMVFVGLDQGVPAGKHLWKVENIDTMIHELAILSVEPETTEKDVLDQLEKNSDAPFVPVAGNSILSGGHTAWQLFDLKPGHYVALCAAPMNWSGPPHAFMGMIKVFEAV